MGISGIPAIPMIITCLLQGTLCDTGIPRTFYGGNICSVVCSDKINPESIIDMNFFGVTFGQMFSSCVLIVDATITIYISTPPFKKTVLTLPMPT